VGKRREKGGHEKRTVRNGKKKASSKDFRRRARGAFGLGNQAIGGKNVKLIKGAGKGAGRDLKRGRREKGLFGRASAHEFQWGRSLGLEQDKA